MAVCGPKLSLCCSILSAWGIFQLTLMGIFFHINSVALIEDISLHEVSCGSRVLVRYPFC